MKAYLGIIFLAVTFIFSQAQATFIGEARFEKSTQTLTLFLVFAGGLKEHEFSLDWDRCQVLDGKKQIGARLIDSGWDDTGDQTIRHAASFNLNSLECKPAELTIFSGRFFRRTLWIE